MQFTAEALEAAGRAARAATGSQEDAVEAAAKAAFTVMGKLGPPSLGATAPGATVPVAVTPAASVPASMATPSAPGGAGVLARTPGTGAVMEAQEQGVGPSPVMIPHPAQNSESASPTPGPVGSLQVGGPVEAQCVGWGTAWYPGVIRELLPNGEIQVLWDGDEPSISNVPPNCVRPKPRPGAEGGPPRLSEVAAATDDDGRATQPSANCAGSLVTPTQQRSPESSAPDIGCMSNGDSAPAMPPPSAPVGASISNVGVPRHCQYDLGPGDDITAPIAHLRRRVEQEHSDGRMVSVTLRITRPAGRPEVESTPTAAELLQSTEPLPPAASSFPRPADAAAGALIMAASQLPLLNETPPSTATMLPPGKLP